LVPCLRQKTHSDQARHEKAGRRDFGAKRFDAMRNEECRVEAHHGAARTKDVNNVLTVLSTLCLRASLQFLAG